MRSPPGLDEQTDRDMMDLFRSMADTGKTVVCITHSLANVERTCHLVVILTAGGRLAFFGKPAEALEYFGIERLGDVYERLAEQPVEHWQKLFKASPLFPRYVLERLPTLKAPAAVRPAVSKPAEKRRLFLRQTDILTRRYFAIWRSRLPGALDHAGPEHPGRYVAGDPLRPFRADVRSVQSVGHIRGQVGEPALSAVSELLLVRLQ